MVRVADAEEVEQDGQGLPERLVHQQQPAGDLLAREPGVVVLADPEVAAQHLDHRQQRDAPAVRDAAALGDVDVAGAAPVRELAAQPALADARIRHDAHHLAAAARALVRGFERLELSVAADEARQPAPGGYVEPRARAAHADEREGVHRRLAGP